MEQINAIITANLGAVVIGLAVLVLLLLIMLICVKSKLSALQKKYDFFTQGESTDIDTLLTNTLVELRKAKEDLAELTEKHRALREQVKGCLQTVKLERYDAFDAMGGKMSYSLLLADENKNGVIITSMYGREESRSYAKDLKAGKSEYTLAEEEKALLK